MYDFKTFNFEVLEGKMLRTFSWAWHHGLVVKSLPSICRYPMWCQIVFQLSLFLSGSLLVDWEWGGQ